MVEIPFLDTTLRDGEQTPGVYFSRRQKLYLARCLDELKIPYIEAGIPVMGRAEKDTLKAILDLGLNAQIWSWNRLHKDDWQASLDCGFHYLHLSVPSSDLLLDKKLGKTRQWMLGELRSWIRRSLDRGLTVSIGAEDASRTSTEQLVEIFGLALQEGAIRVRYADTLGLLTPGRTTSILKQLYLQLPGLVLDFHAHNDFGLATANSVAAWEAGAQVISCTLGGWGERAGNASLEELWAVLGLLQNNIPAGDYTRLGELAQWMQNSTKVSPLLRKPIYGDLIYEHESGIHVDGLIKDGKTYEQFAPEWVGKKRKFIIGKHSGKSAIKLWALKKGIELTDPQAQNLIEALRDRLALQEGLMPEEVLSQLLIQEELYARS